MSQDIVLHNVVLSYPHLFQARQVNGQGDPKFGANFILPETFDWTEVQQAIAEAQAAKWPTGAPANLRMPFVQITEGPYAGRYEIRAGSQADRPPQVVMQDVSKAGPHQHGEFFPGCIVNAYIRMFAYDTMGTGVSAGLNAVQLVNNGPDCIRLDSQRDAGEVFQAVPGGPAALAAGAQPQMPAQGMPQQQPAQQAAPNGWPQGAQPQQQQQMPAQGMPQGQPIQGQPPTPQQGLPAGVGTNVPVGAPGQQPQQPTQQGMPWNQG